MPTIEDILLAKGSDVIATEPTSTVRQAAEMMVKANVGSVIVRDSQEILGIFTERDLLRRVIAQEKDPSTVLVGQVMSSPIRKCRLGDDVRLCADILAKSHIRHLVVIEDGALVGLIGLRDILTAALCSTQEQIDALEAFAEEDVSGPYH